MKKYIFLYVIFFTISYDLNAQDIPLGAATYLDDSAIAEIDELTEVSDPDGYSFELLSYGLKFSVKGAVALELMGFHRDIYVEPMWGLIDGRYVFDIFKTNTIQKIVMVGDFECRQKRWPQKSDGSSYYLFVLRLQATATADPSRFNKVVNEYNVCSKIYN